MRKRFWLAGVVVAIGLSLTAVADSDIPAVKEAASPCTVDSLVLAIDLWYQATLSGDESQTNECEQKIFRLLSIDMERTQGRLYKLIGQTKPEQNDTHMNSANVDSIPDPLQDSIAFLRSTLNVKRILSNSISKNEAFSNKYRLLGDYVELIRRDVGLPKLKLAENKKIETQKN